MVDYVRGTTRHPKWHVSQIRGVTPTHGWNVKGLCFLVYFFIVSLAQLGVKPLNRFWQVITQNAWFWVCCIPRGIKIHKVSVFPHFCPKNTQKWAWIGIFKLNAQNIKTTAPIQTKFCTVTETTKIHFVGGPTRRIINPRWRTAAILKN